MLLQVGKAEESLRNDGEGRAIGLTDFPAPGIRNIVKFCHFW